METCVYKIIVFSFFKYMYIFFSLDLIMPHETIRLFLCRIILICTAHDTYVYWTNYKIKLQIILGYRK